MIVSFDVTSDKDEIFRVVLSSGKDAFFAATDVLPVSEIEIVEIDLERVQGSNPATMRTLMKIAEGIASFFYQDQRAVLYYYCDDLTDLPSIGDRRDGIRPQEYRSELFSRMFQYHVSHHYSTDEIVDITIRIMQDDRPILMHLISRVEHMHYVELIKNYMMQNYGK